MKSKRKYSRPTKKQMKGAVVIDEATMNLVTVRIGVIATCLEAVANELDDLNDYRHCIIPTNLSDTAREREFHSIIPDTLANTIRNTMAQMDKVIGPLLSKNDKTLFQALNISDLFTGAIEEVQKRYIEAQANETAETAKKIKSLKVCKDCGEFHHGNPLEKVVPVKGECFACGDEDVDVYPTRVYNYCGYKVDENE